MDRKLIISLLLSLGTVWLFRSYFMGDKASAVQGTSVNVQVERSLVAGQPVSVPTAEIVYKPLNTTMLFDEQKPLAGDLITVENDRYTSVFSRNGGSLVSLGFKNHRGKDQKPLLSMQRVGGATEYQGAFSVVFDFSAPFIYDLIEQKDINNGCLIVLQGENDLCTVKKTFMIYNDVYRYDLTLDVMPKQSEKPITPRIVLAAPHVAEMADDTISAFSWDESKQSLETYEPSASQSLAWFWLDKKPVFGLQDRYFAHTLIADKEGFVQRGYLKRYSDVHVVSILEGPSIQKNASWTLSFYMGPKTVSDLQAADERLSALLSFGWLSSICKLLIALLDYLYSLLGNFGLAIILMTLLLQLPLTPFMIYAKKQQEKYARYEPSISRITMKYRHDKVTQDQELMRFHKEHNISPAMKMAGCLPQLLRAPIMFALFRVLSSYVGLYQAPFGWITDLSSRDPYYLMPLLTCLSMLWINKQTTVVEEKQRVMSYFMSIAVSALFATFSAGACLYWLVGNLLSIGEEYLRRAFFK